MLSLSPAIKQQRKALIWGSGRFQQMTLLKFPSQKKNRKDWGKSVLHTNKPYLSTEDVAQLFGFSIRTVTAWAAAWQESGGREGIPAFKMGRSWRFERAAIQTYVDSKKLPVQPIKRPAAVA
jgi:excisionase family DNA binding protein